MIRSGSKRIRKNKDTALRGFQFPEGISLKTLGKSYECQLQEVGGSLEGLWEVVEWEEINGGWLGPIVITGESLTGWARQARGEGRKELLTRALR